ncbi:MAG: efflux RND transporter periplasmic adaptor subunit [Gammaproteobacteria bacterium]|jgi:cobalt-zinc-cadmium efflux system membrane fusion protein
MNLRAFGCAAGAWLLIAGAAPAATPEVVAIDQAQRQLLGVETAVPQAVSAFPGPRAPGRVSVPPSSDYMVNATHDGLVRQVLVAPGERVAAGQPLALLDSPAILDLQQEYLGAVSQESVAASALKRDRGLHDDGIISARRLQETESAWRVQHARLQAAEQMLRQVGFTSAELASLKKTGQLRRVIPLRAPVTGTVLEQLAVAGDRVSVSDPVYHLADLGRIWVDVQLPAENVGEVSLGQPVEVGGHQARVIQIGGAVNPASQTVLVRAEFPEGTTGLRPGAFVQATFLEPVEGCFSLPAAAVVNSGNRTVVFVSQEAGFRVAPVQVLGRDGNHTYVHGELTGNERVAVTGVAAIKAAWLGMGGE